jgi:hypothetical protein
MGSRHPGAAAETRASGGQQDGNRASGRWNEPVSAATAPAQALGVVENTGTQREPLGGLPGASPQRCGGGAWWLRWPFRGGSGGGVVVGAVVALWWARWWPWRWRVVALEVARGGPGGGAWWPWRWPCLLLSPSRACPAGRWPVIGGNELATWTRPARLCHHCHGRLGWVVGLGWVVWTGGGYGGDRRLYGGESLHDWRAGVRL